MQVRCAKVAERPDSWIMLSNQAQDAAWDDSEPFEEVLPAFMLPTDWLRHIGGLWVGTCWARTGKAQTPRWRIRYGK